MSADELALDIQGIATPGLAGILELAAKRANALNEPKFSPDDTAWLADRLGSSIVSADSAMLKTQVEPALAALKARGNPTFKTPAGWIMGPSSKSATLPATIQALEAKLGERTAALDRAKVAVDQFRWNGPKSPLRSLALDATTNAALKGSAKWLPDDAGRVYQATLALLEQVNQPSALSEIREAVALLKAKVDRLECDKPVLVFFGSVEQLSGAAAIKNLEGELAKRLKT